MSIVCLGEALVDLIAVGEESEGEPFQMHSGGALANAAVAIVRAGGKAELAGGSGDDRFGSFLRERLLAEGVGLDHHHILPGLRTPFALVHLGGDGEPEFAIWGDGIETGLAGLSGREEQLIEDAEGLVLGSNTLVEDPGLAVTMRAAKLAGESGVPVMFDLNLRPGRWQDLELGLERCRPLIGASALTKCNLGEARLLTAQPELDAGAAAEAVVALGADLAVVTEGAHGSVSRGWAEAWASDTAVADPQPLGAGDAYMGTLVAGLIAGDFDPTSINEVMGAASRAAAEACERVGAIV